MTIAILVVCDASLYRSSSPSKANLLFHEEEFVVPQSVYSLGSLIHLCAHAELVMPKHGALAESGSASGRTVIRMSAWMF